VMQIGITSLSLMLGRTLQDEELGRINELLAESTETSAGGARQPLSQGLRGWLARALQLDPRRPVPSVRDAQVALDQVLSGDTRYVASTVAVEAFISRCVDSIIEGAAPAATVVPSAPPKVHTSAPAAPPVPAPPVPAPAPTPVLTLPDMPEPLRPPETPRVPEAPKTTELPRTPEVPRAFEPAPDGSPRVLPAPDFEELQRTFAASHGPSQGATLFSEEPAVSDEFSAQPLESSSTGGGRRWLRIAAVLVAVVAIGGGATYGARKYFSGAPAAPLAETGTLVVQSTPAGVQVVVDGEAHGLTPARLTLKPGPHILELRGKGLPRVIPLTMTAGGTLSQFVEFAETAGATTGQLDVRSDPPGAKVIVDGQVAGSAPMLVSSLSPGDHRITLEREGATVQHTVTIEPGMTASLVAPLGAANADGPVSGWIAVSAPFGMQIFEAGRLIGTSETDRIMTSAGRHVFEIVNDSLGYRVTRTVQVLPGKVAAIGIELPNGTVNLNAVPWAEVWVDNKRIGETPMGNVSLPIGPHEVVFRHPQFGEKRQAIAVTASAPVRVSIDMRK
jgi:hypothetical protein